LLFNKKREVSMNLQKFSKLLFSLLVLIVLTCFLFNSNAQAQTILATFKGVIQDASGEGLPGANILLKNVESGYVYSYVSRNDGSYIISGVEPGKYEMDVSLEGFNPQKRRGLSCSIASTTTINFILSVATVEEEVVVTAEAPMVEVSKTEVSSLVDRQKIDDLPIYDMSFEGWSSLTILTAGVQGGGRDKMANGQNVAGGEVLIDGLSNERTATGRPTMGIPDDSVQEFRVITNMFQAEYGNSAGLVRSVLTRSGTNQLQGRVKFYYRDEGFSDVGYFVNHDEYQGPEIPKGEYEKAPYEHYTFGGFLGGPIKKDKAHFFLAYEGLRRTSYATITSPLVEHGTYPVKSDNNKILAKVNYQINEKNLLSLRYNLDRPTTENSGIGGLNTLERARGLVRNVHNVVGQWTWFASDRSMNEMRLLYSYQKGAWHIPDPDSYTINRPSGNFGKNSNQPQWSRFLRYQIVENFNLFLEKHHFKFGLDYSFAPWFFYNPSNQPGTFQFDTDEPFDVNNPDTYPYRFTYTVGEPGFDLPYHQFGLFAQDTWRVHSRVTLNIGLRFSYYDMKGFSFDHWNIRNFNPRIAFSWDATGDGKTAIRGGLGTYTANPSANTMSNIQAAIHLQNYRIDYPNYPDPFQPNPFFTPVPGSVSSSTWDTKEGLVAPYTFQTSLGIQREIFSDFAVSADLVWTKGNKMFWRTDSNPVIPGTSFVRPDTTEGAHWTIVDTGRSDYKGLYITLSKRYSHGWGFDIAYTLSKSMTDHESETDAPDNYADPENLLMWGPSNLDSRHVLAAIGIVDLPLGFQMSALLSYRSATPWTAYYSSDVNLDGLRSDYVDASRNLRRGFDNFFINSRISKFVNIQNISLQVFIEIYNVTNKVNFGSPYSTYGRPLFEKPTGAGNPRQFQIGGRIDF
jgi:hypothetical protein